MRLQRLALVEMTRVVHMLMGVSVRIVSVIMAMMMIWMVVWWHASA